MKQKIYRKTENNIDYLVFEANDYAYLNKYRTEPIPIKYGKSDYTKFIIHLPPPMTETFYFLHMLEHNLYGPSFITKFSKVISPSLRAIMHHHIFGKEYDISGWLTESKKIIRREKLQNLKFIYT